MSTTPAAALEIQGHRGARGLAPENTLAGFARALAIGVHTLELDVGMSRDGIVVVHHDARLNPDTTRDAGGTWIAPRRRTPINAMDLRALRALDVGALRTGTPYAARFAAQRPAEGARIPTLAEVVELVRGTPVRLNVELKVTPREPALTPAPEPFTEAVVRVLRDGAMGGRATLQSFDWRVPIHARRVAPEFDTACLSSHSRRWDTVSGDGTDPSPWTAGIRLEDHGGSVPDMVHAAGVPIWSPDYRDLDADSLARARALGLRVVVWTVNGPRAIRRMIRMGVDGIISDYPDRVRKAAEGLGLALPEPIPRPP